MEIQESHQEQGASGDSSNRADGRGGEQVDDEQDFDQRSTQPASSKRAANARPTKSKPAAFIQKLFQMLEEPANDDVSELIKWSQDGTTFSVVEPVKFASQVLPHYFKHNNWNSFIRQLNMYSFQKANPRTYENTADYVQPEWEFKHQSFVRGNPKLLREIVRRAGANSKSGQEAHQEKVEEISRNTKTYGSSAEASTSRNTINDGNEDAGGNRGEILLNSNMEDANGMDHTQSNFVSTEVHQMFESLQRQLYFNQRSLENLHSQFQISNLLTARALEKLALVLREVVTSSQSAVQATSGSPQQVENIQRVNHAQEIVSQLQTALVSSSDINANQNADLQSHLPQVLTSLTQDGNESESLRSAIDVFNQSVSSQRQNQAQSQQNLSDPATNPAEQSKSKGKRRDNRSGFGTTLFQLLGKDQSQSQNQNQEQDDLLDADGEEDLDHEIINHESQPQPQPQPQSQLEPQLQLQPQPPPAPAPAPAPTPAPVPSRDPRKRNQTQISNDSGPGAGYANEMVQQDSAGLGAEDVGSLWTNDIEDADASLSQTQTDQETGNKRSRIE